MHPLSNDQQLISHLNNAIELYYKKAELFFYRTFTRPTVKIDLRGLSAGTATPSQNLLRFNKELLLNNQQHFLQQTVPHEIAHLLAYHLFGLKIRPHGKEWQHIMNAVYQVPAERCHHYEIKRKPTTYYIYGCHCPTHHTLTIRRHNAIKKGRKYLCKRCQTILYFRNIIEQKS